ncbi:MAG: MarC family protein [Paramuribaculum sp.]|nr:MarC family protein [Paramuribaculum sp.]MDE6303530.1 MarC family protein [Paramuribaculum sp.]
MESLLPFAFICLTSFFTLTNPLGTMPVFLAMTRGLGEDERKEIVKRSTMISFIILISFTFCGQLLFTLFGISANGFRIAAGFIILKIGFDMLQAKYSNTKLSDEEVKEYSRDISITPLSIPMLCGPGAIANGIMMMDTATTLSMKTILVVSIALIYVLTYFILRFSSKLVKYIGETGNNVMMRLMGLILMVIAVECFVNGLRPILVSVIHEGLGAA